MNWVDLNAVEQDGEEILIDTKELSKIIKNFDLLSFANHVRYHHPSSLFYIDWKKSSIVFKCSCFIGLLVLYDALVLLIL